MRKCVILSLALVLLCGASALAADFEHSGYVQVSLEKTGDEPMSALLAEYRLQVKAAISENLSAAVRFTGEGSSPSFDRWYFAYTSDELGTVTAGKAYVGTSLLANYDGVAGESLAQGVAWSKSFDPLSVVAFYNWQDYDDSEEGAQGKFGAEIDYAAGFATFGLNVEKDPSLEEASYSVDVTVPLAEGLELYGEFGKRNYRDEGAAVEDEDLQVVGASVALSGMNLVGEYNFEAKGFYGEATTTLGGVELGVSYEKPDEEDGTFGAWAKVSF